MADYTVSLNATQEGQFTRALAYINELRQMESPPQNPVTKAQAIQAIATQTIKAEFEKAKDWDRNKLQSALLEATAQQIADIRLILGL